MTAPEFKPPKSPERTLQDDLERLLATPWGRRIAHHVVNGLCRLERPAFDLNIKDGVCAALHHARVEGARAVGHALQQDLLKADPRGYSLMVTEAIEARDEKPKGQTK